MDLFVDSTGDLVVGQSKASTTTPDHDHVQPENWKERAQILEGQVGEARGEILRLQEIIEDLRKEKMMLQLQLSRIE